MPTDSSYAPNRGDLVWLTFSPHAGHEQSGRRPALVLSPLSYNKVTGLMIACPITSNQKGYPFEVALPDGIPIGGVILSDHVKNVDWKARNADFIATLDAKIIQDVCEKLTVLLL